MWSRVGLKSKLEDMPDSTRIDLANDVILGDLMHIIGCCLSAGLQRRH